MEKFRPSPITEAVRTLNELCRRVIGHDSEKVTEIANETMQTARVTHEKETEKAQNRRTYFRRSRCKVRRSLAPSTGMSLLRALNQLLELREKRAMVQPDDNETSLPPQAHLNRYTLALISEIRNTLSGVVATMMMLHDYSQREARKVYEVLTQDRSSVKPDAKFYGKRTEIKAVLKERFEKTNSFQLEPEGDEIQTVLISETEADKNYDFQGLCANLLGQPLFTDQFEPDKPIPELASNARSFDDDDDAEHRRIRVLVSPRSFDTLIKSLGYTTMNKMAKGPVLNDFVSGNGNNGRRNPPAATEAEIQADINAVVNKYFDSTDIRCQLKWPELEVVVDGAAMSAPFAAISAVSRRFELPSFAKFVQVFATENDKRAIVSNLVLPHTEIANGKAWHSELRLEGRQVVTLTVEPELDDAGNLTRSSLVVGYQPAFSLRTFLYAFRKDVWAGIVALTPAWVTKPVSAAILVFLVLAPWSLSIKAFSVAAPLVLASALTAYLIVAGKIRPAWGVVRLQHLATDTFMASMLVAMLFFGLLPVGRLPQSASSVAQQSVGVVNTLPETMPGRGSATLPTDFYVTTLWPRNLTSFRSLDTTPSWAYRNSHCLSCGSHQDLGLYRSELRQTRAPNVSDSAVLAQAGSKNPVVAQRLPNPVQAALLNSNSTRSSQRTSTRAHSVRSHVAKEGVFSVEVLVDPPQMIPLIAIDSVAAKNLFLRVPSSQPTIMKVIESTHHAQGTLVGNREAPESKPTDEQTGSPASQPNGVVATPQTTALVIFDSPTRLAILNKGDKLNANFKSWALRATHASAAVLECSATGVVQDIKRTDGTNVEIRIGLSLTWVRDGNKIESKLDLVLQDCAQQKDNSHYAILTVPQSQDGSIAKLDSQHRKP